MTSNDFEDFDIRDLGGVIRLTRAQRDVLSLVARGLSSTEVANELHVSRRTVEFHLAAIYATLDVHNRTAAVERARTLKLLPVTGNG